MALPRWFTPQRMLIIFTGMSLVVYLDRGMIASTGVNGSSKTADSDGSGIQGEFALTNFQNGCLPAAFMVGLMLLSPLFAEWSKEFSAFKLMGAGLAVWMVAVAACGLSFNFWSLLVCRTMVGAGEASFVILTAPFIDDYAPPHLRSLWLAIFYMAIPVGYAVGYIYGGVVGVLLGWRAAFLIEAAFMLPFVVFSFSTKPIPLGLKADRSSSGEISDLAEGDLDDGDLNNGRDLPGASTSASSAVIAAPSLLLADLRTLSQSPLLILAIIGNIVHTAVLGMYAYWGPKAVMYMFFIQGPTADLTFGAVTVLTGILGTLTGGVLLDSVGATLSNASRLCLFSVAGGFVTVQLAFMLCRDLAPFVAVFAVGEFILFMLSAPITTIILMTVPSKLRPLAFSVQTISIHVFGDVPSPPLAGWIHDNMFNEDDEAHPQSWRSTVMLCNMIFLVGIVMFTAATSITWPVNSHDDVTTSLMQSWGRRRKQQQDERRRSHSLDTVLEGDTPSEGSMSTHEHANMGHDSEVQPMMASLSSGLGNRLHM